MCSSPTRPTFLLETSPGLEAEVREFDPRLALDGGADGLEAYREIAKGLVNVLPEGWAFSKSVRNRRKTSQRF